MVKVKSWLFTEVRGKVKKAEFRRRKNKVTELSQKRIPFNPRTEAQQKVRKAYGQCVEEWNKLSESEKREWRIVGTLQGISGYNAFMRECISKKIGAVWYEITIDNSANSNDLTDYQVLLEIVNDSTFFEDCQNEQKYLEFYDTDKSTLLNHFVEEFDVTNKNAKIWIKVPSIPANSTKTIYLKINTSRTEDLSNPENVFDFYDDFEAYNVGDFPSDKWTQGNAGWKIDQEDTNKIFAKKGSENSAWARTNNKIQLNAFAVECKLKHLDTGYLTEIITHLPDGADGGDEGYMYVIGYNGELRIHKQGSLVASKSFSAQANIWYKVRVIFNNGEIKLQVLEPDSDELTYSDASPLSQGYAGVRTGGSYTGAVDNYLVRKYTEPEPTVSYAKA